MDGIEHNYVIRLRSPEHRKTSGAWYVKTTSNGSTFSFIVTSIEFATLFRADQNKNGEYTEEDKQTKRICKHIREMNPELDISLIFVEGYRSFQHPILEAAYYIKSIYRHLPSEENKPFVYPRFCPLVPRPVSIRDLEID